MLEATLPPDRDLVPAIHRLAQSDFDALADGAGTLTGIRQLCAAELSKHILLMHGVLVNAADRHPGIYAELQLADAFRLLVRAQERAPEAVARVLALPGVGAWAVDCLPRLDAAGPGDPELSADLAQLTAIAAAAGMRAGLDFALPVRIREGKLLLPGFAPVDTQLACEYALLRRSRAGTALQCDGSAYWLPAPLPERTRLLVKQVGRTLDVHFETSDPYLTRCLRHPLASIDGKVAAGWADRLVGAWRILGDYHPADATAIATVLNTVVPLTSDRTTHTVSATSTAAFGAVAASLPPDDVTLAETLVHECQHLKLCALLDLFPMVEDSSTCWYYAPWRDDPRPARGLLHGACAFFGVTRFWRQQRNHGSADQVLRGHIEFARRRTETLDVMRTLIDSGELTRAGTRFVAGMRARLLGWLHDPVPAEASQMAAEVSIDHEATWRLQHLACDPKLADRLARSWSQGCSADAAAESGAALPEAALRVRPGRVEGQHARGLMLTLRYTNPERFRAVLGGEASAGTLDLSAGDRALLHGDHTAAVAAYRAEIRAGPRSPASWAGLVAAARTADGHRAAKTLLSWLPLAFAVHVRVANADPLELAAWLATSSSQPGDLLCRLPRSSNSCSRCIAAATWVATIATYMR